MRVTWHRRAVAGTLGLAVAVAVTAWTGVAAAKPAGQPDPAVTFPLKGVLTGVAAASASDVWAVGYTVGRTGTSAVIVHWNGHSWKRQASPGGGGALYAVTAISARDAWAVGDDSKFNDMILHWNGSSWKRVPAPAPGVRGGSMLSGVAATSAGNAWAVGEDSPTDGSSAPLVLRWNGSAWKQVAGVPNSGSALLSAITARTARDAWAVGLNLAFKTVILHWNGSSWKRVPSPTPTFMGGATDLTGIAAPSARLAFAAGMAGFEAAPLGVLLTWNGAKWTRVPLHLTDDSLAGVAATSVRNAWAVGSDSTGVLILRWNGRSWDKVPGPGPAGAGLNAITATSATRAWAVGSTGRDGDLLIASWNGKHWS